MAHRVFSGERDGIFFTRPHRIETSVSARRESRAWEKNEPGLQAGKGVFVKSSLTYQTIVAGLAFSALTATAQIAGIAGTVVDQKGYRLRNVIIAGDGQYDTTDMEGKFGDGRGMVVAVRGALAPAVRNLALSGSTLRFTGLGLGSALKAELLLASGRRAGHGVTLDASAGRAELDLNALAAGLPREGLYVLKAETANGSEHHLLARLGNGSWTLSGSASTTPGRALRKSAVPTTLRISKPGYEAQTVGVPGDGKLGVLVLKLDASSSVVDAPFDVAPLWYPTGWMGDHGAIKVAEETVNVRSNDPDAKCTKWTYQVVTTDTAVDMGWSAVVWQYPSENWGGKPGRRVTGATKVTFWARGGVGGEIVDFKTGSESFNVEPEPGMWKDTYGAATNAALTTEWAKYEIPLDGANTSMVISGFLWATTMGLDGAAVTFYLDELRFE